MITELKQKNCIKATIKGNNQSIYQFFYPIMLLLLLFSDIVSTSIDIHNRGSWIRAKQQWNKKFIREKMEQQRGGNTYRKYKIGRSNAPTLCCCCCWCYCFGAVFDTKENCLKINSTTKYPTQNFNEYLKILNC